MIDADAVPEATASRERHADFLEIQAFKSVKRSVSFQEFLRDLKIANATEAIADSEGRDEEDQPDDRAEPLAEAAFSEIDDRNRDCGHDSKWYPFEISGNTLTRLSDFYKSRWRRKKSGPSRAGCVSWVLLKAQRITNGTEVRRWISLSPRSPRW